MNGVADILGIFLGHPLAIEVKTPQGRLSEHQRDFLMAFRKNKGIAMVVRSTSDLDIGLRNARDWIQAGAKGLPPDIHEITDEYPIPSASRKLQTP